jgi:hypothetical protein
MAGAAATLGRLVAPAALMLLFVASCTTSSEPTPAPTAAPTQTPTPTESPSPSLTPDEESALAAYLGFRDVQVRAEADPSQPVPDLEDFAADQALVDELANLATLTQAGIAMSGEPVFDPAVTDAVDGDPPSVTIEDCVDVSGWVPVYVATGESAAAPGTPARVLATATVSPREGTWKVVEIATDRSGEC